MLLTANRNRNNHDSGHTCYSIVERRFLKQSDVMPGQLFREDEICRNAMVNAELTVREQRSLSISRPQK